MTDRLKAHLRDGRGLTRAERQLMLLELEGTIDEDELYIGDKPVRTLARSLKEDDDYYYGDTDR